MTPQGAFLLYIKAHTGLVGHEPARVVQTEKLVLRFLHLYRSEGKLDIGGISGNRLIDTGRVDKNVVETTVKNWGFRIGLTAVGVKAQLRRLRPQEAELLAKQDEYIDHLRSELRSAEQMRKALLRDAFTKGHVVTVAELRQVAEAKGTLVETVLGDG